MCGIIGGNAFSSKNEVELSLKKILHRGRNASQIDVVEDFLKNQNLNSH